MASKLFEMGLNIIWYLGKQIKTTVRCYYRSAGVAKTERT